MTPFIMLPKNIFELELSSDALLVYMQMLDTYKLSYQNNRIDDNGIFLYYSISNIEKSRGCSRPTATNILKELEKNGYIIKKAQKGKPTKIYLVRNEFTEFVLGETKKSKDRKIIDINEKSESEQKQKENIMEIIETFKQYIGREPDNSFKQSIKKRLKTGLDIKTVKSAIEKAFKAKAKNKEAFILYLTQYNQTENVVEPEQTTEPTDKPLDEWEIEWHLELMEYNKQNGEPYSQEKIDEYKKLLDDFRTKNLEKQITDMLANS